MKRLLAFLDLGLWRNRQLLWQFAVRNIELRNKGSHLGLIWSFLNPLLMLGLYVFVFGYIFGGSFGVLPNESRIDYGLGIFFGLTLFHFVAEVLGISPTVIIGNPNFVKKVVFPLEILPAAAVIAAGFHMLVSFFILMASVMVMGPGISITILWLPIILLPLVFLMLGVSWLFSTLAVFFRDIGQVMQFITMALMFSSAVFYSSTSIPPAAWTYLRFNPILLAIELARDAALWGRPINDTHLIYLYVLGIAACYFGHAAFRKLKPAFADVL